MTKILFTLTTLIILAGCSNMSGLTVHKEQLRSLKEYENGKCQVNTEHEKTIKTNFACNKVKYFE
jgi:hypothetical protein